MKQKLIFFGVIFYTLSAFTFSDQEVLHAFATEFPEIIIKNEKRISSLASNGIGKFKSGGILLPRDEGEVLSIIDFYLKLKKNHPTILPLIVAGGGRTDEGKLPQGWSFDAHAFGKNGSLVINTRDLKGFAEPLDFEKDFDEATQQISVSMYSGTTWRDTVDLVNRAYFDKTGDPDHYFVPIVAPTGGTISLGGSFASNSHARASSVLGGYFSDAIESFTLATVRKGRAALIPVSRTINEDLFNVAIGSFGRGGMVVSIRFKLQRVSAKKKVITTMKRVGSIEELTLHMFEMRKELIQQGLKSNNYEERAFLATGGIIKSDFNGFILFDERFEETTDNKPAFPLFERPHLGMEMLYGIARAFPSLAGALTMFYIDWQSSLGVFDFLSKNSSGNKAVFHNEPLNNYIFFQDIFTRIVMKNPQHSYRTGHIAFLMEFENVPTAMNIMKEICSAEEFKTIAFELQDILPIPRTQVKMASGYSDAIALKDDPGYVVYTLSWPINDENEIASKSLRIALEKALFDTKINGKPLAWLHPSKEFGTFSSRGFYKESANQLENILQSYQIDDAIFTNKIQKLLYSGK